MKKRVGRRAMSRRLAAVIIGVVTSGTLGVTQSGHAIEARADAVRVRKDVKALTAQERRDFVDAVLKLKTVPSPYKRGLSYYDQFVDWHVRLGRCDPGDPLLRDVQLGHGGPIFLPWHRQFVLLLERALRDVSRRTSRFPTGTGRTRRARAPSSPTTSWAAMGTRPTVTP